MPIFRRKSKWLMLLAACWMGMDGFQQAPMSVSAANSPPVATPSLPKSADSNFAATTNSPEAVPAPAPLLHNSADAAPRYIGAGSCSARACHGNPALTRRGESNSAYAIWIANDPHAQAYAVLFTPESQRMAGALNLGEGEDAAAKSERCLVCHALPVSGTHAEAALGDVASLVSDGVSCEACHGPAEKYLAAHTMRGWRQPSEAQADAAFGMKNTADIASRAKICAGCHVGQPDADGRPWRDVNHDLIAAGHPRLNFDFAAYMATLPAHWNTQKNPERFDELRSLLIGQFTAADASLKLLASRAQASAEASASEQGPQADSDTKPAHTSPPLVAPNWPEFSEYDCFSCHHELRGRSWRQQNAQQGANPLRLSPANPADRPEPKRGTPGWGTWYFEDPRILADSAVVVPQSQSVDWLNSLNRLTLLMQTPLPNAGQVAQQARSTATKLEDCWSAALGPHASATGAADSQALRAAVLRSLTDEFHRHRPSDWDEFVQYYLALVALERSTASKHQQSASDGANSAADPLEQVLQTIRNRLSFPAEDRTGPQNPHGAPSAMLRVLRPGFNSPLQFDPDAKQADAMPNNPAGKSLVELFDEAFRLLGSTATPPS